VGGLDNSLHIIQRHQTMAAVSWLAHSIKSSAQNKRFGLPFLLVRVQMPALDQAGLLQPEMGAKSIRSWSSKQ